jgi:hypothetical protein
MRAPRAGGTLTRRILSVAVAAVLLAPVASATHMQLYRNEAVQHDLQGSSREPDGLATAVLGPPLSNCVMDLPLGGVFGGRCGDDSLRIGLSDALAPGCTGDDEAGAPIAREAGRCGLWTIGVRPTGQAVVPPGTVGAPLGEPGMGGTAAPGRATSTKGSAVQFFDGRLDAASQTATTFTFAQDPSTAGLLGPHVLPGDAIAWAWWGAWADRNGNGVIDHLTPGSGGPTANEFVWLGSCTARDGARNPDAIAAGVCAEDPNPNASPPGALCADPQSTAPCAGASVAVWVYPGNHHSNALTGDAPGNQVLHYAQQGLDCGGPPSCDDADRDFNGDPLLGTQGELSPDMTMQDRTGDAQDAERQWVGGTGATSTFYGDDGLLLTTVVVYGADCAASQASPWRYDLTARAGDLGGCTFLDVDRYEALNGDVEALLTAGKDLARSSWLVVRDGSVAPAVRFLDSLAGSQPLYDASQGPLRGELDDRLLDPGWSREPNAAALALADGRVLQERFVGVEHRACDALPVGDDRNPTAAPDAAEREAAHRGWCNAAADGTAAYAAYRGAVARGWSDAHAVRSGAFLVPLGAFGLCPVCITWVLADVPGAPEPTGPPVSEASDHARPLGPGAWYFAGKTGRWRDAPHTFDESLFPDGPGATSQTYPDPALEPVLGDGWVGSVVRSTGQWHYRGFLPTVCATEKDAPLTRSLHDAAECDPYLGGSVSDPQDYALEETGEWQGACSASAVREFLLAPLDGALDTQILVWRNHEGGVALPTLPPVEAYGPGPVAPLALGAHCAGTDGAWRSNELLLWPQGNAGDDVVTWFEASVDLGADLDGDGVGDSDLVGDLDLYADWGLDALPPKASIVRGG